MNEHFSPVSESFTGPRPPEGQRGKERISQTHTFVCVQTGRGPLIHPQTGLGHHRLTAQGPRQLPAPHLWKHSLGATF